MAIPEIPPGWLRSELFSIEQLKRHTLTLAGQRVAAKPDHLIRVMLDGAAVDGAGVDEAGRPQGMIPLADDRREHYVKVDICQ